jgi:hypothetical protein
MILLIWVTNGLRQQHARSKARSAASQQRAATLQWQREVEATLGKLGTLAQGPAPPTILSSIAAMIGGMERGTVPKGAVATLTTATSDASTAIAGLAKFALRDTVANKGFDVGQVDDFLNSQTRFQDALQLYQRAAAIAVLAAQAKGAQIAALATQAAGVKGSADKLLGEGWTDYQNALSDGGLVQTPLGAPGVPAGS